MKLSRWFLILLWLCGVRSWASEPLWLAHYMPWYGTREARGQWGWHWTMNHFDPDRIKGDGEREIASHDYPLMGVYDSGDPAALECQVLLMKFAGIDGVIVDWYGTGTGLDFPANHENSQILGVWLKRAGLKLAVCYEDQALGQAIKAGVLRPDEVVPQAVRDFKWLEKNWFSEPNYVQINGRPVVLVFGPQHLQRAQWGTVLGGLQQRPWLYGLPHLAAETGMDGIFGWPPVEGGKVVPPERWKRELEELHGRASKGEKVVPPVFPGFKDIYQRAGVHDSYGTISARNGATLAETAGLAAKSTAPIIQIATWNDYGEGTVIEPTRSRGYRSLELLQRQRGVRQYGPADLRLPVMLCQLRRRAAPVELLDKASELLFNGKCIEAEALLAKAAAQLGKVPAKFPDSDAAPDPDYRLVSEVLYREEPGISGVQNQRCRLDLYFPVKHQPYSTVVWFHGGGLTAGERSVPTALQRRGIAVAAVNYRLAPEAKSPEYLEDAAAAVAWVLKNVAGFGGDKNRVFVAGHSAGAYLTLMLGLDRRWLNARGADPDTLAGLIPLSPQVITHFAIREERGGDEKQPVVDELAPLFHVKKEAPPILLVTGDREKELLGRYEENAYFWRMMKVAGHKNIQLRELQGFDHSRMADPAMPLLLEFVKESRR